MNSDKTSAPERKAERPILQFSVMCDAVATPKEIGNKPVFIGVFANLLRPGAVPQFFIANRWINGIGDYAQTIRILDPTLNEIARSESQPFSLPSKVSTADIFSGFVNMNFGSAGVYWIRIELDGKLVLAYPFPVLEGKQSLVPPQAPK